MNRFVAFALDGQRFALPLDTVERAVRTVEVTPLPKAPPVVKGVVNVRGAVVPVVDLRARFGLPEREAALEDHLLIAKAGSRTLVLPVDAVTGVEEIPPEHITAAEGIVPGTEYVRGVAKRPDGLVVIHDLATFLSLDEARALDRALAHLPEGRTGAAEDGARGGEE